jgi:hypothetical protein
VNHEPLVHNDFTIHDLLVVLLLQLVSNQIMSQEHFSALGQVLVEMILRFHLTCSPNGTLFPIQCDDSGQKECAI